MDNTCLFCGEIIPEGRDICPICENELEKKYTKSKTVRVVAAVNLKSGRKIMLEASSYLDLASQLEGLTWSSYNAKNVT